MRWLALCVPLCFGAASINLAFGQEEMCDLSLPEFVDHQHAYRNWGDRCEGIYAETPVSGATISVFSFTRGKIDYEMEETPLTISWPNPLERPVRLRAKPLRPDLFYQMDTLRSPDESDFEWPATFLSLYRIAPRDLAVLGWVDWTLGTQDQPVYLPLNIKQGEAGAASRSYELLVVPGVELKELSIAIERVDEHGKLLDGELERTDLGYGFYPPDSGVPITLPDLSEVGFYQVKLWAKRRRDDIERERQFWFYHSGD